MLCLEGNVRTLLVFQGKLEAPKYSLTPASQPQKLILDKSVLSVRPHVIGAVLRGVTFNKARYNSFIDPQDKFQESGEEEDSSQCGHPRPSHHPGALQIHGQGPPGTSISCP